ncbi:restriction endonuclease, partial [Escherichia coli]|uniref:restriction endonuclease n=1 Tax=Escherichia coli TaxID=562 RepID=UPI001C5937E7
DAIDNFAGVAEEAVLRVADRIGRLDWYDMQRLVAAFLRALGYRTEISPVGPDRGKDIFASPDGFGFEQPRIAVEVKHRPRE